MNSVETNKVHRKNWDNAREELYAVNGPLHSFRPFSGSNYKSRFKNHITSFLETLHASYITKLSNDIAPLAIEERGSVLYNQMQASDLNNDRRLAENRRLRHENANRTANARAILQGHGLVPPTPVYRPSTSMTSTTNQHTNRQTSTRASTPSTTTTTRAEQQQSHVRPICLGEPPSQRRRVVNGTASGTAVTNGLSIDSSITFGPRPPEFVIVDDEDVRQPRPGYNDRMPVGAPPPPVPHNQRPMDKHRDMIDRMDKGNSITSAAMERVEQIFNSDRMIVTERNSMRTNMLNSVASLLAVPGVATNNPDLVQMASNAAKQCISDEFGNNVNNNE